MRHHRHHDCRGERRRRGPIARVVRGLAERFGIHRSTVIAGFVLGFIFVPMLTLLVFLGALYWANDPARTERRIDRLAENARATYRSYRERSSRWADRARAAGGVEESESAREPVPDFPELRRKFEELEARAQAMEAGVASEEFALNRQFRTMGR